MTVRVIYFVCTVATLLNKSLFERSLQKNIPFTLVSISSNHTCESFASEPLFVKNAFAIFFAVNMLRRSSARSWNNMSPSSVFTDLANDFNKLIVNKRCRNLPMLVWLYGSKRSDRRVTCLIGQLQLWLIEAHYHLKTSRIVHGRGMKLDFKHYS